MTRKRDCLPLSGMLLLDKPTGMTSNQALQRVKRHLQICKAGHTGSLDPIASGLLPLCLGEATKLAQFVLEMDKRYWAQFRLGVSTDTYDTEGRVTATRPVTVDPAQIAQALQRFNGTIAQVPPMYSALKVAGRRLYARARAGEVVERTPRTVTIYALEMLSFSGDLLEIAVTCSRGTYIRSLAHDLGEALGCGAHLTGLRRETVGGFSLAQAVPLAALLTMTAPEWAARLLPEDQAAAALPAVTLPAMAALRLCQGQNVAGDSAAVPGWIRLYESGGRFLGIGRFLPDGRIAPKRLLGRLLPATMG